MAESITFNNAVYIIPDVGESNWGQNLTNFFVAIPQGCYQLSGGTAPLTADLNFGTNFGLFAKYLTSTTTHPSGTGTIRLANTDAVSWRNAGNSADLPLSVDSSNNLLWNGDIISTSSSSPVLSIAGTANQITASAATGNVTLSVPSTFIAPGSIQATSTLKGTALTLTNTTNQIVLGTTNTVTISSTAPASSRTYTLPDAGGAANIVLDAGNYTIGGTWSFSNSITLASSKAIILTDNTSNTVTLKATNSTTSWTLSLPTTHGSANQFLQTDGSGNTSWAAGGNGTIVSSTAGNLTLFPSSSTTVSDTYVQNSHNITLGIAAQASRSANLNYIIPNPGNAVTSDTFALLGLAQTFTGVNTFSGGAGGITLSSSTIAMGSNKITGLANGTASTDAAAFGQIPVRNVVTISKTSDDSVTGASFGNTTFSVTITPSSSSAKILIIGSGSGYSTTTSTPCYTITNTTTSTQLGGTNGLVAVNTFTALDSQDFPVTFFAVDSPGSASAQTYFIQLKNTTGGSNAAHFGDVFGYLMALEIH